MKKAFTKLDLQQGYNNIWIKKRDKQKVVFTISKGFFEHTVMFFGLTNSLAMFQTMMNEILQNLINTGEVTSFTNNIIVGIEEVEGYDEMVEEVIKRLAENNLYVILEKCKQKVSEVGFLGVVIGPDMIKIEEEKVKGVLNWLTS